MPRDTTSADVDTYKDNCALIQQNSVYAYIPWYSDALGVAALRRDGLLELLEARGLLELLDQALNGLLAPFVLALGLLPAQQPLDDRRVKAGQHRSHHLP